MIHIFKVNEDRLEEVKSFDELSLEKDIGWVDLLMPSYEEDKAVENFLQISIPTKEDMQEIELSARLYEEGGAEYMTMVAVAQMHLDDPIKTPVTFIIHGNMLVTVRYNELTSFIEYTQKAQRKNGVAIASAGGLMLGIVESFIDRIADSLEALGTEIDQISSDIFRSKKITVSRKTGMLQVVIKKVGAKGDLLSMLRESLVTISRVLSHHHVDGEDVSHKVFHKKMMVLTRDVLSLNDHAGFLSGKMNFLLDATLGMINLEQNQIIKIFSVAAVVFLPPTLVASIYGMNFHFMPELDWKFGYPMALGLMIVSAVLPFLYFKKKGWL